MRLNGTKPLSPDTSLKKIIRPAIKLAGIEGKAIGWHSFRHSLATNLRAAGVDLKTAQELLRHANSRITLDVYTRAISATKREANNRVMEMVIEAGGKRLSAPSQDAEGKLQKGSKSFSTLSSTLGGESKLCHLPQTLYLLRFSGGDDGARTRDLCRDSEPDNCNLLKQCVTDGPF